MSPRAFEPARVVGMDALGGGYHHLILEAPHLAAGEAGTFALISTRTVDASGLDPLLPRPFSFLARDPEAGRVEIFFREVGRGTRALARLPLGSAIPTLGPLGCGFTEAKTEKVVLLAGGVGMPPLLDLGIALSKSRQVTCFYGGRSRSDLHFLDRFEAAGITLVASTDDGTMGASGTNVAAFEALLSRPGGFQKDALTVYACGPTPMLRAASALAKVHGLSLQISLEANMACGIGICRGCAVARNGEEGYAMVCQDGPVFSAEEVTP